MKVLIWFFCFFIYLMLQVTLKNMGIILGGIPTFIAISAVFAIAKYLCKLWDNRAGKKKAKKANVLDDVRAVKDVQKLKEGKEIELSVSQITSLIINLSDANKNLSAEEFEEVNRLFKLFRSYTTKVKMNQNKYMKICISIINSFDEIAPYEKYSGGDSSEFTLLMSEIRNKNIDEIRKTRKQIKNMEYYIKNTKPYFESIKRGDEQLLTDEEIDYMVKTNRMSEKEAEDYRNAKDTVESQLMMEDIMGKDFAEKTLAELKERLAFLIKEGLRQPCLETKSEPVVEERELHNNFCRKCGAKLQEDSKFCHKCGTEVIKL